MGKEIDDLKKLRSSLSLRIRKRVNQNKNAYDLVEEYTKIKAPYALTSVLDKKIIHTNVISKEEMDSATLTFAAD